MKGKDLIYDHDLKNQRFGDNVFFIIIYIVVTACTSNAFTFGKC